MECRSWGRRLEAWLAAAGFLGALMALHGGFRGDAAAGGEAVDVGHEVPVTPASLREPQAYNSPTLAADPTEPRFVALASRTDNPDFGCTLQLSGNGGRGWVGASAMARLPSGADKCYAPDVAFDRAGLLYYLFVGLRGRGNHPMGVFLSTSADRGRTFTAPRRVLGPHVYMPRMVIDADSGERGRIHLVWVQAGTDPTTGGFPPVDNPIMAAFSDDGGDSFSDPVRVSDTSRSRAVAPAIAVGQGGAVHVLYYDLGDDARDYQGLEGPVWEGKWSLVMATSTDRGGRFGAGVVVEAAVVPPERIMVIFTTPAPALTTGAEGAVVAGWWDARNGDWDVLVRRSDDGGRTWARPIRLNDDAVGNGRHQYLLRLASAPGGRVDAVFYDRRDDPDNVHNDVFFATSTDGGRKFSANVKLTTEAGNSRVGPTFPALASATGLFEMGSRLGLLSRPGGAVAAWADPRNAEEGAIQQDVLAVDVRLPMTAGTASDVGSLLAVLAAGGVVVLLVGVRLRRRSRGSVPGSKTPWARLRSGRGQSTAGRHDKARPSVRRGTIHSLLVVTSPVPTHA